MEISNIDKIRESLEQNKRFDKREMTEFRDITIETGISKNAEGSARVTIGNTVVVAGVKVEVSEPYTDHEDEGTMITTFEMLPLSSSRFEYGPPTIEAVEAARIIDRGIRESGFIDFKKLCIKKGEKVYTLLIDVYSLNDDGNLIDAGALAAVSALLSAKMPEYDEKKGVINYGKFTSKKLPLSDKMPLTITFHKISNCIFVDPTREEEISSDGRISLAITDAKDGIKINAIQKGGLAVFSLDEIDKIFKLAIEKFKELKKKIKDIK